MLLVLQGMTWDSARNADTDIEYYTLGLSRS
jgi:hypothetical protein